jgi:hypothetical protein
MGHIQTSAPWILAHYPARAHTYVSSGQVIPVTVGVNIPSRSERLRSVAHCRAFWAVLIPLADHEPWRAVCRQGS